MISGTATLDLSDYRPRKRQTTAGLVLLTDKSVREASNVAVTIAKAGQFKDRTGRLRSCIRALTKNIADDGAEFELVAIAPYAAFIEWGTKPHWIRPKSWGTEGMVPGQSKRGRRDIGTHRVALRWYGPDGKPRFARAVWHPGTEPIPFMVPAAQYSGEFLAERLVSGFVNIGTIWN